MAREARCILLGHLYEADLTTFRAMTPFNTLGDTEVTFDSLLFVVRRFAEESRPPSNSCESGPVSSQTNSVRALGDRAQGVREK